MSTSSAKAGKSSNASEYTAILLAGLGGNLIPFTNPENIPKALLPLANKALISYPLSWLEKAGISSIIILCVDVHESAISHWLKTSWKGNSRPTLVAASDEDEIVGSADAIRTLLSEKYKDKIKSEVVIMSCDSICDIPPYELLDFHRRADATITSVFHRNHPADVMAPIKKGSKTFTGYDDSTDTLLYTNSEADVEDDLELRTSMLWKYPKVTLTTTLTDLHLYICKKSILDIIVAQPAVARVNTDLLPLLCKAQFQSLVRKTYQIDDSITAKIFIPDTQYFCARGNTKQTYVDLNKHLLKSISPDLRQPASTTVGERTVIGPDSALGQDSAIDEKTTIKRTLIGSNVKVGKMCRINGCLIMDNVEIRDGVKLENCVICANSTVCERVSLKDCTVGGKVTVPEKTEKKGEEIVMGGEISLQ